MKKQNSLSRLGVRRKPGNNPAHGLLLISGRAIPCRLGKAGITTRKCEGDSATPAGRFRLLWGVSKRKCRTKSQLKIKKTGKKDGWCDDPAHPAYNRPVTLPFGSSHEKLLREDRLYDICIILDYNMHPRMRNRGSAIFFHLTSVNGSGTEGCVAIDPDEMRRLLPRLSSKTVMRIFP